MSLLPSPCQDRVGRHRRMFSELDTPPGCTSVNASPCRLPDRPHHSRPRRLARSYLVRLSHSQLSPGFSPAHPDTFSVPFSVLGKAGKGVRKCCVKKGSKAADVPPKVPDLPKTKPPKKPKPQPRCPNICPPPNIRVDRVPPGHTHPPCPGDHWHIQYWDQTPPPACLCKVGKWRLGGCLPQQGSPPDVPWP